MSRFNRTAACGKPRTRASAFVVPALLAALLLCLAAHVPIGEAADTTTTTTQQSQEGGQEGEQRAAQRQKRQRRKRRGAPVFDDYDMANLTIYPKLDVSPDSGPTIEEVSESSPTIFLIHNALTRDETAHLREIAKPKLVDEYAEEETPDVMKRKSDRMLQRRDSQRAFFVTGTVFRTKEMKAMYERLANVTGFPISNYADVQVNLYKEGGKYEPHYDFKVSDESEQEWSMLLCLSTLAADQGGETVFPLVNVAVRGVEGMAVVFRNIEAEHKVDKKSWHGGAPVKYGEKWNANQWVMTKPVPFGRKVSLPILLKPWGGEPPLAFMRLRQALIDKYGEAKGLGLLYTMSNGVVAMLTGGLAVLVGGLINRLMKVKSV